MTTLYRFTGGIGSATSFDTEPSQITPGFVYARPATGSSRPYLNKSGTGTTILGKTLDADLSQHSVRMYVRFPTLPGSGSITLASPLSRSGAVQPYKIVVTFAGAWRVHDAANAQRGWSTPGKVLVANTWYRFEWQATPTTLTARVYEGDSLTVLDEIITTAQTYGAMGNFRVGQMTSTPDFQVQLGGVSLRDTLEWIGPAAVPADVDPTRDRVAIIGDSLTAMVPLSGQPIYDALAARGYPMQNVAHYGVGGKRMTVADAAGRVTSLNLTDLKTVLGSIDHAVIALGTNDTVSDDTAFSAAVNAVLDAVVAAGVPRLTWIGLTYQQPGATNTIRCNPLLANRIAARTGITARFIDPDPILHDGRDETGWWVGDGTHMTATGYAQRAVIFADAIAPLPAPLAQIAITDPAEGSTVTTASPTFAGTSNRPTTAVQLAIAGERHDTTTDAAGAWSLAWPTPLSDGSVTLTATTTNADGVAASATRSFTVDVPAPAATIAIASPADGSTSTTATPAILGTSNQPGGTVSVSIGPQIEATTAGPDGAWSLVWPTALAEGPARVTALVKNSDGVATTDTRNFIVDVPAPLAQVAISEPADGATVTTALPTISGTSDAATVTVTIRRADPAEPVDAGTQVVTTVAGGAWSVVAPVPLPEGLAAAHAEVVNADGVVTSDAIAFTVDTPVPLATIAITSPADGSTVTDSTPTIAGTTSEAGQVLAVEIAGRSVGAIADSTGAWSLDWPTVLPDGPVVATATVANADGVEAVASVAFMVAVPVDPEPEPEPASTQPAAVVRIRSVVVGEDRYGNDVYERQETPIAAPAAFAPQSSVEPDVVGRTAVITKPALYFLRSWPDLTPGDRVRVRGVEYEVDGYPEDWRPLWGGDLGGLVVSLKVVDG